MFLRRRIVLLTLALILAIVVISMTIVGLLISSYNERYINKNVLDIYYRGHLSSVLIILFNVNSQQAEAEAREAKGFYLEIENEKKVSSIAAGFPDVGDPDKDDERDTFLPVTPGVIVIFSSSH